MPFMESHCPPNYHPGSSYNSITSTPDTTTKRFKWPAGLPVRYFILALVLVSTAIEYVCRYNINVSMVAMAKALNHTEDPSGTCPVLKPDNSTKHSTHEGSYDWDARTQGSPTFKFLHLQQIMTCVILIYAILKYTPIIIHTNHHSY